MGSSRPCAGRWADATVTSLRSAVTKMDATAALGPLVAGPGGLERRDAPPTLDVALRRAAGRWPERPALAAPSGRWRYAELDAAVDTAAAGMAPRVGGDVVAALLGDDAPLAVLPFVASRLRATALLLPWAHGDTALAAALATARPVALLADTATRRRAESLAGPGGPAVWHVADLAGLGSGGLAARRGHTDRFQAPAGGHDPDAGGHDAETGGHEPDVGGHDVVWLTTSGSTGTPKLVRVTEANLVQAAAGYLDWLPLGERERSLAVMPLTYVGPLTAQTVLMPLIGGCLVVAGQRGPPAVAAAMAAEAITHVDAVPAWLARAATALSQPLPAWRALVYGGAPTPPDLVATLARAQPQLALLDAWGLAEASGPVAARRTDAAGGPAGALGPWSGVTVRAVDDAGRSVTGATGELQVAGATVTPGYVAACHATPQPAAGADGWLATGDLGAVDAHGGVWLRDRRRDVVLRGGATVASVDVEGVLRRVDGVADVAVVALADRVAGEAVAAVVVAQPGCEPDPGVLRARVRAELGAAAVPRAITWRDALPLGPTGKVDKATLRAELQP